MGRDTPLVFLGLSTIESTLSLFVANLAVVSTCLYQYFSREAPVANQPPEASESSDKESVHEEAEKSEKVTTARSTHPATNNECECSCVSSEDGNTLLSFTKLSYVSEFTGSHQRNTADGDRDATNPGTNEKLDSQGS